MKGSKPAKQLTRLTYRQKPYVRAQILAIMKERNQVTETSAIDYAVLNCLKNFESLRMAEDEITGLRYLLNDYIEAGRMMREALKVFMPGQPAAADDVNSTRRRLPADKKKTSKS